jgi:glycine/D-amino acid oxidase-like deaminating enzyme
MARLLAELALPLRVTRQEVFFFAPGARPDAFRPDRFPVWVHLGAGTTADDIQFYGFPIFGRFALKLARFAAGGPGIDPDRVERAVSTEAAEECRAFLDRRFPGATDGRLVDGHTCLFTMTPDEDFVIDLHPDDPRVALAAGFSGHGFKFASAVGRALAGLALEGRAGVAAIDEDRGRFAATRFGRRAAPPGPS